MLPATFRLRIDSPVVLGGEPFALARVSEDAARRIDAWRAGAPVGDGGALARALVLCNLAQPVPPAGELPPVSVVIPVRDRSIARLLGALDVAEVIVVDDASADGEALRAEAEAAGARYLRRDRRGGAGAARNTGLAAASHELVACIDSDCVPRPGWLEPLLPHFADPELDAVAPRIVALDDGEWARGAGGRRGGAGGVRGERERGGGAERARGDGGAGAEGARGDGGAGACGAGDGGAGAAGACGAGDGGAGAAGARGDGGAGAAGACGAGDGGAGAAGACGDGAAGAGATRGVAAKLRAGARRSVARYEAARSPLDRGDVPGRVLPYGRVPFVPGAAIVVRRHLRFDETLRGGEDVEFCWRVPYVRYEPAAQVTHDHRTDARAWLARRVYYGTTAAGIARRQPGKARPLHVSPWTTAAWLALAARRPLAATAITAAATALLANQLRDDVPQPLKTATALATLGTLRSGRVVADAATRHWWPLSALAAAAFPRTRLPLAMALLLSDPRTLPDDLAYGLGLWRGCIEQGTLDPLLPAKPWRFARRELE